MATDISQIFYLLIIAMAAARVAVLIAHDSILAGPREWIFLRWPPVDNHLAGFAYQTMDKSGRTLPAGAKRDASMLSELITCTRCLTVWTGAVFYLWGEGIGHGAAATVAAPLAVMAAAAWIARRI